VYEHLVRDALRRREIFNNLGMYLERLKEIVLRIDPKAEVYLFGSVAERRHNYSSDVDILVVTEEDKLRILEAIAKEEFIKIFEVHVRKPGETAWYKKTSRGGLTSKGLVPLTRCPMIPLLRWQCYLWGSGRRESPWMQQININ